MNPGQIEWMRADDGTRLALHHWASSDARAVVFYIHGIQSHAGWLFETGPELAKRGVALFALDRRGSGKSDGPRGHVPSLDQLMTDYLNGVETVLKKMPHLPTTLVGQSFGGSVLAGLCATGRLRADRLVFCAPALGQQRRRHSLDTLEILRNRSGTSRSRVPLKDEDYTDDSACLDFMAADQLALREITEATKSTMVRLEDMYAQAGITIDIPTFFATPERDRIIDLVIAREWLLRLAGRFEETTFATDCHYIEFGGARRAYWDWLAACAIRGEGVAP